MKRLILLLIVALPLWGKTFLMTPRRTGTHWLLYSIEYLTKHRWIVQNHAPWNWFDLGGDDNLERYIHCHELYRCDNFDTHSDKVILLIRNYREAMLRDLHDIEMAIKFVEPDYCYFGNLELFEAWDPELRLLVRYEDLLNDPESTYRTILNFLDIPPDHLPSFMEEIDLHKKRVMRYYRRCGGARSKGKDFNYHTKKLTHDEIETFDRTVAETFPILWDHYLHPYAYPFEGAGE